MFFLFNLTFILTSLLKSQAAGQRKGLQVYPCIVLLNSSAPSVENLYRILTEDFPGGTVVKNPPATAGDTGSSPGLGRSHMPRSN